MFNLEKNVSLSFEEILLSYNLRLNPTYHYVVGDCLFDSISYLLKYSISSISLRQNSMNYLKHCLLLNTPKAQRCRLNELNPSFLHDLHEGAALNEHEYVEKMSLSATMGGLWGDFTTTFWIAEYLQRPIHVWNKQSKRIMQKCGIDYINDPLNIAYSSGKGAWSGHFEPIDYIENLHQIQSQSSKKSEKIIEKNLHTFQYSSSCINIELETHSYTSQETINLQSNMKFHWTKENDSILMQILQNKDDLSKKDIVSLFNHYCQTNISTTQLQSHMQFLQKRKLQHVTNASFQSYSCTSKKFVGETLEIENISTKIEVKEPVIDVVDLKSKKQKLIRNVNYQNNINLETSSLENECANPKDIERSTTEYGENFVFSKCIIPPITTTSTILKNNNNMPITKAFRFNEKYDIILIQIIEENPKLPMSNILSLFNTSSNTNITLIQL
jgi:hypothetical protein